MPATISTCERPAQAWLGDLPDTLTTRSVVIRMRKHPMTERLEPYLRRKVVDLLYVIEPLARVAVIQSHVGWDPEAGHRLADQLWGASLRGRAGSHHHCRGCREWSFGLLAHLKYDSALHDLRGTPCSLRHVLPDPIRRHADGFLRPGLVLEDADAEPPAVLCPYKVVADESGDAPDHRLQLVSPPLQLIEQLRIASVVSGDRVHRALPGAG